MKISFTMVPIEQVELNPGDSYQVILEDANGSRECCMMYYDLLEEWYFYYDTGLDKVCKPSKVLYVSQKTEVIY